MIAKVTEDNVTTVPGIGRRPRVSTLARRGSLWVSVWTALLMCAVAAAGPDDGNGRDFSVTVRDLSEDHQRVLVPLNRSVLVETSIETARADVIAGHIVDVQPISPTQLLLTGKSYGTTQVILWGEADHRSVLEVSVELDVQAVSEILQGVDPQAQIEVRSVMGNIVLTGSVSGAEAAQKMVELAALFVPAPVAGRPPTAIQNHLRVAGEQQVLLRCVVAEVSRAATRQLGINGFLAGDDFRDMFVVNQLSGINPANIQALPGADVTADIPFLTGDIPLGPASTLSLGFPRVQMQLFIKAMAENSLLKILAEPNLVCISGETAEFHAGGEFPVPVPQGNQTVTVEFRDFGITLNFTPVVNAHQSIHLRVLPIVSEVDFSNAVQVGGFVVPGLTSRSAETTVEIGNGQTIAIAGLLSEEVRAFASRIPGIGDLPVLGPLFRSVEFRRDQTELVILVTPEIVAPLDPQQVTPVPGQFMTDPSDFELYALGLLESRPRPTPADQATAAASSTEYGTQGSIGEDASSLAIRGPWGYADAGDIN